MRHFEFTGLPWRVVFGPGAVRRLPQVLADLGLERPLLLASPGRARQAAALAAGLKAAGIFDKAAPHVPAPVVEAAARMAESLRAGCTISVGGGSTTGLGKALRLRHGLPQVAVPMTYAGSEMTNIWGITEERQKTTGRDPAVLPLAAIYDPDLLASLPLHVAGPSAMNAMAQAAANVGSDGLAAVLSREGLRLLFPALRRYVEAPGDADARSDLLYGACLAGAALGVGSTGLHHRICHTLGGMFGLPHADMHAVLLPYSIAYDATGSAGAASILREVLDCGDPVTSLHELMNRVCATPSLRALGLSEAQVGEARIRISASAGPDAEDKVSALLAAAWSGQLPGD